MKISKRLWLTTIICVLSALVWYNLFVGANPLGDNKEWVHGAFFASGFLVLLSFFQLVFFFGSEMVLGKRLGNTAFWIAFRRALFVAGYVLSLGLLQWFRLLGPLEAGLLALFVALLEYAMIMSRR